MPKRQSRFPYRLGAWPREYHIEYPDGHPLRPIFWIADLREARVFRLSPTLWRFRTDDGALDIVTASPELLTWDDFAFSASHVSTTLQKRMTRRAMTNTANARFIDHG